MTTGHLPIEAILGDLATALKARNMAVVQAPPGAGKTTRIPLFLLQEDLYSDRILMLEPRRLAARAAAMRMADTLGQEVGQTVGYRMRGDTKTSKATRIEVVTEGVLTRMIQTDPELNGISCVIFDEFHERSLQSDFGLALTLELRDALRPDLHVIVMSATLDADPVARLMGDAPLVTSEGRSYPVEERHLPLPQKIDPRKRGAFETAVADLVHLALSETEGGVLVFLPGEGEINRVAAKLGILPGSVDVRPLFGRLPFKDQQAAIQPVKAGRKVVLATAIAETSLTIEDIRVVVDAGRARRAQFDPGSGMSRLVTERVTRAEATQRQGRAGRVAAGICYKMWAKAEDGAMAAFPEPEIRRADLSNLVLELALWGATDPVNLPFLTLPKDGDYTAAQDLLRQLGCLDTKGAITGHGRQVASIPAHPRLAHMVLGSDRTAGLTAALLSNRDCLMSGPSDLTLRFEALEDARNFEANRPYKINRAAMAEIKRDAHRLSGTGKAPRSRAEQIALAYPDRIGLRRAGADPRFLLSGGMGAKLPLDDALASSSMLVAAELDGKRQEATIRSAIPISEAEVRALFADSLQRRTICEWSDRDRAVRPVQQTCLGALVLDSQVWKDCPPDAMATAMCQGVRRLGLTCLPWSETARLYRARVQWLFTDGGDVPDLSDETLMDRMDVWLMPYLSGMKSVPDLKRLDMAQILRSSLTHAQVTSVDQLVPSSIAAPTGTKLAIDYSGDIPKVSVRVQELFGLTTHPTVGHHRMPLQLDLLSPARRPVQTTSDLPGFWAGSYADVKKDMKARYPRHPWPDDPTVAAPTTRVKHPRTR